MSDDQPRPKAKGRTPITPLRLTPDDLADLDELVRVLKLASRAEAVREAVKLALREFRPDPPKNG